MQLAFASGRIQNPATTSTTKSLQCFNVLVRVNSAGSSTCSNCHFVQPKLMANHLLKVKRESSKQIKQMDCQASRARTTRVWKHCWSVMGLVVTQNWPERSPCCIVLAAIAKGILSCNKRLPTRGWTKIHTGNIDGFWKGAKKAIPDSLHSQKKEQTERQFVEVPQTLPMALGMHGEKHNETYSRDLEELVNCKLTRSYSARFWSKSAVRVHTWKLEGPFFGGRFHSQSWRLAVAPWAIWQFL